jgi:GrpB-like predicted nucleotidyltransferase (UPF0157 family)
VTRRVEVVPYDESWPQRFAAEAERIRDTLGEAALAVEHVGSTSVPGLSAKPTIDIAVAVASFDALDVGAVQALGYDYVPEYEAELPERRYFRRPGFHLHVYERDHPEFVDYLRFRDRLRSDPGARREYEALKVRLAAAHPDDRERYQDEKKPFIEGVLAKIVGI